MRYLLLSDSKSVISDDMRVYAEIKEGKIDLIAVQFNKHPTIGWRQLKKTSARKYITKKDEIFIESGRANLIFKYKNICYKKAEEIQKEIITREI